MNTNDDGYFDERIARTYDDDAEMFDSRVIEPVVDFLVKVGGEGKALELGIGTGRIALPLAGRGITVHGIDLSRAMLARLASKPGAENITVTVGDFATTTLNRTFSVVYLVFNTIMNLTSQSAQVDCFRNAARHLKPGGCFVIEVMLPRLQRLPPGETLVAYDLNDTHWGVDEYDVASQGLVSNHLRIINGKAERFSAPFRYVWPSELDLMAQIAGMKLKERWGGWKSEPFTSTSQSHVSVWEKIEE
jgi:SAM-dependent methyltransferase